MGLFSRSKKTEVETEITRAIPDDQIPNTRKDATLEAILGGESIGPTLIDSYMNGPHNKVNRMFDYGRDEYVYGLPSDKVFSQQKGKDVVRDLFELQTGTSVVLEYFTFNLPNITHLAWEKLTDDYGYDQFSNELTGLNGSDGESVYLSDIVPVYGDTIVEGRDDSDLEGWGLAARHGYTPDTRSRATPGEYRTYTLQTPYDVVEGDVQKAIVYTVYKRILNAYYNQYEYIEDSFELDFSNVDSDKELFQTKYSYTENNNRVFKYWTYDGTSGTYPTVDAVFDENQNNTVPFGTYFPIAFFRSNRTNITADPYWKTDRYKQTKKMLDFVDLDYQVISDSFHEEDDIDKVEQAVFMMAVPANSDVEVDQHYLFDYFKGLSQRSTEINSRQAVVIEDADFKATLSYDYIENTVVAGSLPDNREYQGTLESFDYTYYTSHRTAPDHDAPVERRSHTGTAYKRIYRKKLNETYYEEIAIYRPQMTYAIWKSYEDEGTADSDKLLIPLDKSVVDNLTLHDREQVYFRSMHFVLNARQTEKGGFFSRGFIQIVITFAAIAITIFSAGSAWGTLTAAFALGTAAFVMAIAQILVIGIALNYGFKLTIKELGVEAAYIIAIIALAYSFGAGYQSGGIKNAPWANELLLASNGLIDAANAQVKSEIGEYQSKQQEFNLYAEEKFEELEEVKELLETDSMIDPFTFIGLKPKSVPGELADNFYQRTVHSGNIGTLAYDAIEYHVEASLKLPNFNDSLGDNFNG